MQETILLRTSAVKPARRLIENHEICIGAVCGSQRHALLSQLKRPLDGALLVDVPFDAIVARLTSRRCCKDCGAKGRDS